MSGDQVLDQGINITIGQKTSGGTLVKCLDNDTDDNIYVLGSATYGDETKSDYCDENGLFLFQVYCSGTATIAYRDPVTCKNGCQNGECLSQPSDVIPTSCVDNDEIEDSPGKRWGTSDRWGLRPDPGPLRYGLPMKSAEHCRSDRV